MKNILSVITLFAVGSIFSIGCIQEANPQGSVVSLPQVQNAPGAFESLVANLTSNLSGKRIYGRGVYDFGYTSFFYARDVEGQDIVCNGKVAFNTWYSNVQYMASGYAICQYPWTLYYKWINNCNVVLKNANAINYAVPDPTKKEGAGIAYTVRAMLYLDLARMYAQKPYSQDPKALTTIKADETRTADIAVNSERMTWEEAFDFILKDLSAAEACLKDYKRTDNTIPDLSVVYGLMARTYLEKQDWAKAEEYAKKAQTGYTMMTKEEFLSHENGFNSPNSSWIWSTKFVKTDPSIQGNDGDDSWGSVIIPEAGWEGGYQSNYGGVMGIDKHLYSTIPSTDFRKDCWVDFAIDDIEDAKAQYDALKKYTSIEGLSAQEINKKLDANENIDKFSAASGMQRIINAVTAAEAPLGGYSMKFRNVAGKQNTKYDAWCVSVPMMRVEEMKLIEIEAAGMQDEARGKVLLEAFAKTRDPQYVYGKHNEAYYNPATSAFQNEVWWQRRVELWGEGFSTFDIKRLGKGIIRSYNGTNHPEGARWNTPNGIPNWMVWAFVGTESDYNAGITLNPAPEQPTEDSAPYEFISNGDSI